MKVSPQLAILVRPKCEGRLEYREADPAFLGGDRRLQDALTDGAPIMRLDEAIPL